jgi:hypothetical protein
MGKISRQQLLTAGVLGGLSLLSVWAGYYVMFSRFDEDESYVMISLKYFMRGFPLYDNVYTQYGPAFYFLRAVIYPFVGDSFYWGRLVSLGVWVLIALLLAIFTYRLTTSTTLAAVAQVVTFRFLTAISEEPGHPQEVCGLILALALLLSLNPEAWPLIGILAGILLLIKVNIGVFFLVSIGMLLSGRLRYVSMLAAVLLPVTLMRHRLTPGHEIQYAVVATASIAAVSITMLRRKDLPLIPLRSAYRGLIALVITVIAICGITLLRGTSVRGLIYGVVLQHAVFGDRFDFPLTFRVGVIPAAFAALILAVLPRRSAKLMAVLKLGFCIVVAFLAIKGRGIDLFGWGRGDLVLLFAAPYLWLGVTSGGFSQAFACAIASLQILQAYPIPGSQTVFGTLFFIPVGLCGVSESLKEILPNWSWVRPKLAEAVIWTFVGVLSVGWVFVSKKRYYSCVPVNFPGAKPIRMAPDLATKYTMLVRKLTASCDSFITWPGVNSLYFWTGMEPPTHLNATEWSKMLNDEQQQEVIRKFSVYPHSCAVVRHDENLGQNQLPLVAYIANNFHEVERIGDFILMARN